MSHHRQHHDLSDRTTQYEFARAGIRRCLVELRGGSEQTQHLHDVVTFAFEICAFGVGYVAATSTEPRPTLGSFEQDLFRMSAHNPWEAEAYAATDFARLIGGFIGNVADWLNLRELTTAVPLLRAAFFVQARQHFGRDCTFNPPVIQHWCCELDTALEQGEPVAAILHLRALRDGLLAEPDPGSDWDKSSGRATGNVALLDHDPGPSPGSEADMKLESEAALFAQPFEAMETADAPFMVEPIIQSGVDIPTQDDEGALARLSRHRADMLINPQADPLRFAQVAVQLRLVVDRITSTRGANVTSRRRRLQLVPRAE